LSGTVPVVGVGVDTGMEVVVVTGLFVLGIDWGVEEGGVGVFDELEGALLFGCAELELKRIQSTCWLKRKVRIITILN
jgi:hypothetical protein